MADNVPLSVVSSLHLQGNFSADIAVGKTKYNTVQHGYWFVVLERSTLKVVDNINQTSRSAVPNLGTHNTVDHILIVATAGIGLNNAPQGDLFNFIDKNGGGRELRKIEQIGMQFNCGSYGAFGYALVGILGNQNRPAFELSQINAPAYGPFLALTLVPTTVNGKTIYTPQALSNS